VGLISVMPAAEDVSTQHKNQWIFFSLMLNKYPAGTRQVSQEITNKHEAI
jgi:hypothetical protein